MKHAIFGDVHANLEALTAVLADAKKEGATHYACVGDVVGYNADPHECAAIVRALGCPAVKGNHDEDASAGTEIAGLNPLARKALEWTRKELDGEDKKWLAALPLVQKVENFTLVHATLDTPRSWAYVMNKFDAMASLSYQFTQVCFCGHTHTPKFYVKSAGAVAIASCDTLKIEKGKRYLINVGSVGQPRDGYWRAAYVIYDRAMEEVSLRRVPYDIEGAQKKISD